MKIIFFLVPVLLWSCGEQAVKKIIMKPSPPSDAQQAPTACSLKFSRDASLKQIAIEAAQISDACNLNESQLKALID